MWTVRIERITYFTDTPNRIIPSLEHFRWYRNVGYVCYAIQYAHTHMTTFKTMGTSSISLFNFAAEKLSHVSHSQVFAVSTTYFTISFTSRFPFDQEYVSLGQMRWNDSRNAECFWAFKSIHFTIFNASTQWN